MNKLIKTTILLFLSTLITNAQDDYKHSLKGIKKVIIATGTKVHIVTGDTNQLIIGKYDYKCEDKHDNHDHEEHDHDHDHDYDHDDFEEIGNQNKKSKGLKAIYSNGIDNTGFGLLIEKEGDVLKIKDLKSSMQRSGIKFTLPKTMDISLDCGNLGSARIENFASEIEVKSSIGHIHLIDVTGPVTARSNVGGINVEFVKVNQNAPITITTATASVDVTLPKNTNADLVLKTTMGTVYTNFDLDIKGDDDMKIHGNRKIVTKLNNGGVKITLSSSTGNVYLRKKE